MSAAKKRYKSEDSQTEILRARWSAKMAENLAASARDHGLTSAEAIRIAVWEWLEKRGQTHAPRSLL